MLYRSNREFAGDKTLESAHKSSRVQHPKYGASKSRIARPALNEAVSGRTKTGFKAALRGSNKSHNPKNTKEAPGFAMNEREVMKGCTHCGGTGKMPAHRHPAMTNPSKKGSMEGHVKNALSAAQKNKSGTQHGTGLAVTSRHARA